MDKNEELKRVHAPYNFVPFSSTLIKRYEKIQELPPHDQIDPKLKTGEIYVRLEAEMPIYVSNGQGKYADSWHGACKVERRSCRLPDLFP